MLETKTCTKCGETKTINNYYIREPGKRRADCKSCIKAANKLRYDADPDLYREKNRQRVSKNPEANRERSRKWRVKNSDYANEYARKKRAENPELAREQARRRYSSNPEHHRQASREWYAKNTDKALEYSRRRTKSGRAAAYEKQRYHNVLKHCPDYKAGAAARDMLHRTLKQTGSKKRGRTAAIIGYTSAELKEHLEKNFAPGMDWSNRSKWHIDHIVPVMEMIRLGITCPKKINALSNLRPAWSHENISKGDGFALVSPPKM